MSSALDAVVRNAGNAATWSGGISAPVAPTGHVKPVTDQSDHVSGGMKGSGGTNAVAGDHAKSVMYYAAGIVLVALALLWLTGGLGLRSVRL